MADGSTATILRRKADRARAGEAQDRGPIGPGRALSDAFRRAAEAELQLTVMAGEPRQRRATPAELLEGLPEQAFLGILIGPEDGAGLFCMDADALSAVIEMRTMGRVSARPAQPRRATRTDAAMVADLIDKVLAEFEAPLLGTDDARWASGWRYQLYLPEPRPLPVVLEEAAHRVWETEILFGAAARPGKVLIALPAAGRALAVPPESPPPDSAEARATGAWRRSLSAAVETAEVTLDTELGRLRLSLGELATLAPGDRIALPLSALGTVRVSAAGGRAVALGRLGQAGGARAVMLSERCGEETPGPAAEGSVIVAGALHGMRPAERASASPVLAGPNFAPAGPGGRAKGGAAPMPGGDVPDLGGGADSDPPAFLGVLPEPGGDLPDLGSAGDTMPGGGLPDLPPLGGDLPDLDLPDTESGKGRD